ncbi:MAG: hypothetical protein HYU99_10190 [Deltaproteobacteria bacterium]|nr:hypothetical protein [Deltaproteobacteria bacterium]
MDIKPIRLIQKVEPAEIPQTRIDRNLPRAPVLPKPPPGKWDYSGGRIVLNGRDVAGLIEQTANQKPVALSKLAGELEAFRNYYIRKNSKKRKRKAGGEVIVEELDPTGELGHLSALVDAYIAKIMRLLKRKYDEKADGLSYSLDDDGQLVLNGMNVTAFIRMAEQYPGDKARLFLKGLKERLSVILSNKTRNPNYEKIYEATQRLFEQIDLELKRIVEKERLIENK